MREGNLEMVSALWSHDALAINDEFVSFGLPTENWVVVENETGETRPSILVEEQGRRKATDSSADNNAIEHFASVDRVWQ